MRTIARTRPGRLAHALALALALAGGMAQAQVSTPPVAPMPPAKPDPVPPVSPLPVTPPEQVPPAVPPGQAQAAMPAPPAVPAQSMQTPATPRAPSLPPPPETTPPGVAANQAAELAKGDPARWNKPDATAEQRLRTLRKEAAAAYQEAKVACREEPTGTRKRCMDEARSTYEKDLAHINKEAGVR